VRSTRRFARSSGQAETEVIRREEKRCAQGGNDCRGCRAAGGPPDGEAPFQSLFAAPPACMDVGRAPRSASPKHPRARAFNARRLLSSARPKKKGNACHDRLTPVSTTGDTALARQRAPHMRFTPARGGRGQTPTRTGLQSTVRPQHHALAFDL
jgi:hypothetical protein